MTVRELRDAALEAQGPDEGSLAQWCEVILRRGKSGISRANKRAHNGETRIYVESFRRCDEMTRVRQFLMSNTPAHLRAGREAGGS